jgi:hypothetical protein
MSNHTKEEWLVDREDYSICVMRDDEPLAVANLGAMDHNGVKYVIGDETWSNAYLIRTAPQMLAMLEEVVAKAYKLNWNDPYTDVLARAEKVLALATAGTPAYDDEGEL